MRVYHQGNLPQFAEEGAVNQQIPFREKDAKTGVGVIPAQYLSVRMKFFALAQQVKPRLLSKRQMTAHFSSETRRNRMGDDRVGRSLVRILDKLAEQQAADLAVTVVGGMAGDVAVR